MPTITELNLEPDVAAKARELLASHPGVVFTSGRRTVAQQARAMSSNVLLNRRYIGATYRDSAVIRLMQQWVDTHPEAKTLTALTVGLNRILRAVPEGELSHISLHLVGRAFDVAPGSCPEQAIRDLKPTVFLTHEGGLTRWHAQW